jgi:type VI secretion system protein ImpF
VAILTNQDRLQPSLLDRLIDDAPQEAQESRDRRVLSLRKLREGVLRDLGWLLNSVNLAATTDLSAYPEVAKSVMNYGMPDLTGMTVSTLDLKSIELLVKEVIVNFEPRILANTLKVTMRAGADGNSHNTVGFDIEGELWAQPVPLKLLLKTDIDLEAGFVNVIDYLG